MENYSDIFIIGGGINGTAIAADAAGRGLSVSLCERNDLASGTSSASSKLIHGGLRYLEFYELGLVRSALQEREILLRRAPHLISPLEFVLPHEKQLRPAWLIRLGLFLYDHLTKRHYLPRSKALDLQNDIRGNALFPAFKKGFSYFDCFTDDARLVIENALSAKNNGAEIFTYTAFLSAKREKTSWKIELQDTFSKNIFYRYAKVLINASGPWVKEIHNKILTTDLIFEIQLDKGSHIVVPKLYEGNFAYILQNTDKRMVFAIPFQQQFTLIGTTDNTLSENVETVKVTTTEEDYLLKTINHYFKKPLTKQDIIWSYSGVRCLQQASNKKNISTITRDYKLLIENKND
jgi:glycerol-3-phosphate dehydrogenase